MVTFACLFPARPGLGGSIWGLFNPGRAIVEIILPALFMLILLFRLLDCSQIFHA